MPRPADMERYEQLHPGAAEMIFHEFAAQSAHRREMEHRIIRGDQRRASIGQWMGLVVALTFLAASVWLVLSGYAIEGTILGTVDLTALVTVFIVGGRESGKSQQG